MLDYFDRRRKLHEMEDQAIRENRLPPGQSLTVKWPILDTGIRPSFNEEKWRFRVFGLVHEPAEFTWRQFAELPRITHTSDVHCVTHWTKLDNRWEGTPASTVLNQVRPQQDARYVMVHAPGYEANLSLEALLDDDVLFAFKHDGEPIPPEHGGPVRLVVPKRYFWKSVKWVNGLEFMAENRPGYWERRGYHLDGDPWSEERFDAP